MVSASSLPCAATASRGEAASRPSLPGPPPPSTMVVCSERRPLPTPHCSEVDGRSCHSRLVHCQLRPQTNCTRCAGTRQWRYVQLQPPNLRTYRDKVRSSNSNKASQGTACKYQIAPRCTSLQRTSPGSHTHSEVTKSSIARPPTARSDQICRVSDSARACRSFGSFGGKPSRRPWTVLTNANWLPV